MLARLRSARGHASAGRNKLKLTIGYTTNEPVTAKIQIHGLGTFKRHLGKSGVLRLTRSSRTGMHEGRVDLDPVGGPGAPPGGLYFFVTSLAAPAVQLSTEKAEPGGAPGPPPTYRVDDAPSCSGSRG